MKTRLVLALLLACAVPASADRAANRAKHHTFVVCRRAARQAFHTAKGACPKAPPHDVRHACIVATRTVKLAAIAVCRNPETSTTAPPGATTTTSTTSTTCPDSGCTTTTCPAEGCAPPPVDVGCGLGVQKLTLTVPLESRDHPEKGNGSDLDNGWTGISHNFPVIGGSSLVYCLTSCDAVGNCQLTGQTGEGTPNGTFFGAPLPLLAANIPVCVTNQYVATTLTGTYNTQTGDSGTAANPNIVDLTSTVYLRSTFPNVCPKCQGPNVHGVGDTGKCDATSVNAGDACTVDGEVTVAGVGLYELSRACKPRDDSGNPTPLAIHLEFTTGEAKPLVGPKPCPGQAQDDGCNGGACSATCTGGACNGINDAGECVDAKGGISQLCCAGLTQNPCFPTKGGGSITRHGKPGTNGQTLVNATTFCIPATNSSIINLTSGLPGPGALILPAVVRIEP